MGARPKTIKAIITKKINKWAETIEDPAVKALVLKNTIVTGGCIASLQLGEPINDFDVYFRNRETTEAVADYYVAKFLFNPPPRFKNTAEVTMVVDKSKDDRVCVRVASAGIASENSALNEYQYFEQLPDDESGAEYVEAVADIAKDCESKPDYRPVFFSTNAITLSNDIQIVTRFYGEADDIHENYDFAHCTSYWDAEKGLVLRPKAMEALLAMELKYVGSKYPLCSIIRTRKFIERGFKINAGQYLKMCMQLNELDLSDPAVLEEQLTGVDAFYFMQVLDYMKAKNPDKIDGAYLCAVIDKIF